MIWAALLWNDVSVSECTFAFATWFFPCFETYAVMAHDPEPAPEMVPVMCESVTKYDFPLYDFP
jgi:hypothetical protein